MYNFIKEVLYCINTRVNDYRVLNELEDHGVSLCNFIGYLALWPFSYQLFNPIHVLTYNITIFGNIFVSSLLSITLYYYLELMFFFVKRKRKRSFSIYRVVHVYFLNVLIPVVIKKFTKY